MRASKRTRPAGGAAARASNRVRPAGRAAVALAVLLAAMTLAAPPASAAKAAEVCVFRAAVHDTPRGLVIGHLHDGARVQLLGRTANRRWYRLRGPLRIAGWTKARNVCR